jgi:hypothetical protein
MSIFYEEQDGGRGKRAGEKGFGSHIIITDRVVSGSTTGLLLLLRCRLPGGGWRTGLVCFVIEGLVGCVGVSLGSVAAWHGPDWKKRLLAKQGGKEVDRLAGSFLPVVLCPKLPGRADSPRCLKLETAARRVTGLTARLTRTRKIANARTSPPHEINHCVVPNKIDKLDTSSWRKDKGWAMMAHKDVQDKTERVEGDKGSESFCFAARRGTDDA